LCRREKLFDFPDIISDPDIIQFQASRGNTTVYAFDRLGLNLRRKTHNYRSGHSHIILGLAPLTVAIMDYSPYIHTEDI
jgi:hypothetical protein